MTDILRQYYSIGGAAHSVPVEPPGGVDYITDALALSPVAFWGMQETSGNIVDLTGNGWTGTAFGNFTYQYAGPTINTESFNSILFDGSTAYFTVADTLTDPGTTGFTVAGFMKHPADAVTKRVLFWPFQSNEGTFYIRKGNGYGLVAVTIDTSNGAHGQAVYGADTNDTWQFFGARYNVSGAQLRVYQGTSYADAPSLSGTWKRDGDPETFIGRDAAPSATYWNGALALMGYWNSPLSDANIESLRTGVF